MLFSPVPPSRNGFGETLNVPTFRAAQAQLVVELRRARRYEHPLAVILLSLQLPARERLGNGTAPHSTLEVTPAVYSLLGAYLRNTLRETDILTGMPELLAFGTFLPNVDRQGAERAFERFRDGFLECAGFDLRAGFSAFPLDGLTIEDVLEYAITDWRRTYPADVAPVTAARYSHG